MFELPTYEKYFSDVKSDLTENYNYSEDVINDILSDEDTVDWYIKKSYEKELKKLFEMGKLDKKEYMYQVHIAANGINLEN